MTPFDDHLREFVAVVVGEPAVELDAIHPDDLRSLVSIAIEQHMPLEQLEIIRVAEEEERHGLELFAKTFQKTAGPIPAGSEP